MRCCGSTSGTPTPPPGTCSGRSGPRAAGSPAPPHPTCVAAQQAKEGTGKLGACRRAQLAALKAPPSTAPPPALADDKQPQNRHTPPPHSRQDRVVLCNEDVVQDAGDAALLVQQPPRQHLGRNLCRATGRRSSNVRGLRRGDSHRCAHHHIEPGTAVPPPTSGGFTPKPWGSIARPLITHQTSAQPIAPSPPCRRAPRRLHFHVQLPGTRGRRPPGCRQPLPPPPETVSASRVPAVFGMSPLGPWLSSGDQAGELPACTGPTTEHCSLTTLSEEPVNLNFVCHGHRQAVKGTICGPARHVSRCSPGGGALWAHDWRRLSSHSIQHQSRCALQAPCGGWVWWRHAHPSHLPRGHDTRWIALIMDIRFGPPPSTASNTPHVMQPQTGGWSIQTSHVLTLNNAGSVFNRGNPWAPR